MTRRLVAAIVAVAAIVGGVAAYAAIHEPAKPQYEMSTVLYGKYSDTNGAGRHHPGH